MSSMSSSGGTSDFLITPPGTTVPLQTMNCNKSTTVKPSNLTISKRFYVHSSALLKSPLMNKFNHGKVCSFVHLYHQLFTDYPLVFDHPQAQPNERLRLVAEQYRVHQRKMLIKAKQLKLAAEERAAAQELLETKMLLEAAQHGDDFTSLDPQTAINVARAARNTLLAEEHLAVSRVQECEAVLTGLRDAVDEVHARVEDANLQVGRLLNIMNEQGIRLATSFNICMPPSLGTQAIFNAQFPSSPSSKSSYYSESIDGSVDGGESDRVIPSSP